jgi:hypothetical protein
MRFVKLKRNLNANTYKVIDHNDNNLWGLAEFLEYVAIDYNYYMSWLTGKLEQYCAYGSCHHGLEELNGRVYIEYSWNEQEGSLYKSFNTTKETMIKIIDNWLQTAYADPQPSTILITQEGEEVIITAQD